jgi:hypothetical protein
MIEELSHALLEWRKALPFELHPESVEAWSHNNIWILVLRAMSCRFESVLWREARKLYATTQSDNNLLLRAFQKQRDSLLELDTIFDRIVLHDLVDLCPFSM